MNRPTLFIQPLLSTAPLGLSCCLTHKWLFDVAEEHSSQQKCIVDLWREIWSRATIFLTLSHCFLYSVGCILLRIALVHKMFHYFKPTLKM